jgi:hypothetical protein
VDPLKEVTIKKLREARQQLLEISKDNLTGFAIQAWYTPNVSVFQRSDSMSGHLLQTNIVYKMQGSWQETDADVCIILRTQLIELIDQSINAINSAQQVRPVLEDLILKVSDTKLSTLLKEFNEARTSQPNLACAGFRTVLPLIIRERAKKVDPTHSLATKDDIKFEPDINTAIQHGGLFNSAELKLIQRYLSGGDKDSFDNVVHKPDFLIDKSELDDAVNLLNHLLPTIVDV